MSAIQLPGQPTQCPPVLAAPVVSSSPGCSSPGSSSPPSIPPEAGRTTSWQPAWSPRWSPPSRRRAQGRACAETGSGRRSQPLDHCAQGRACAGARLRWLQLPSQQLAASVTVQPRPSPVVSSPPQASPPQVRGAQTARCTGAARAAVCAIVSRVSRFKSLLVSILSGYSLDIRHLGSSFSDNMIIVS